MVVFVKENLKILWMKNSEIEITELMSADSRSSENISFETEGRSQSQHRKDQDSNNGGDGRGKDEDVASDLVAEDNTSNESSGSDDGNDQQEERSDSESESRLRKSSPRTSRIRDMLIFKEINNDKLSSVLPPTCTLNFNDPNKLHVFTIRVTPFEGFWKGGTFIFNVIVPEEYNFEPPKVKCATKIWHPNITADGAICLSILRAVAIDGTGWNPARQLKDVIFGINSLFTDLVTFDEPLNNEAAEMYRQDPRNFQAKVDMYIRKYAQNNGRHSPPAP